MKKIFALVFVLTFALTACSARSNETALNGQSANVPAEPQTASQPDGQEKASSNEKSNTSIEDADSKVLVVYFSCTGNTEGIANHIVNTLGADVYEIVPEEPYTDADLNYSDSFSRSTKEQNDDSCRPAISGLVENMDDYDTIVLGYPIWWGQAPKIIYTFVESYDLSGKTIVSFCTSGSSGVGSSATNLHRSAASANWLDGVRFSSNASQSSIEEWLSGLPIEVTA